MIIRVGLLILLSHFFVAPEYPDSSETELLEDFSREVPSCYKDTIVGASFLALPSVRYSHKVAHEIADLEEDFDSLSESEARQRLMNVPLNKRGSILAKLVEGKDFIDLGCGVPTYSFVPRIIAEKFKAKRYIGVDAQYVNPGNFTWTREITERVSSMDSHCTRWGYNLMNKPGEITRTEFKEDFLNSWIADDMLGTVSKYTGKNGVTFFIAGIQPDNETAKDYLRFLAKEIARTSNIGDATIIVWPAPEVLVNGLLQSGFSENKEGVWRYLNVFIKTQSGPRFGQ